MRGGREQREQGISGTVLAAIISEKTGRDKGSVNGLERNARLPSSLSALPAGSAVVLDGAPGIAPQKGVVNRFAFRTGRSRRCPALPDAML